MPSPAQNFWRAAQAALPNAATATAMVYAETLGLEKDVTPPFTKMLRSFARLQSTALRLAAMTTHPQKKVKLPRAAKPRAPWGSTVDAASPPPPGKGVWQGHVHKTAPNHSEWLGRLSYFLYTPVGAGTAGMPLLILLHGCQQTARDLAQGSRINQLADAKGFVIAYPQQTKRVNNHRCWRWFEPSAGHGFAEADAIASLIPALVGSHTLDASRVYVAGLSAGAGMAALVALRHPDLVAAVGLHSGVVMGEARNAFSALQVMRLGARHAPESLVGRLIPARVAFPGMPAMILHGAADRTVAPRNANQLAAQFLFLNGLADTPPTPQFVPATTTAHAYTHADYPQGRKPIVSLYKVEGLGHAWSGGDARMKFHAREGPHAALLFWRFFEQHRRLETPMPAAADEQIKPPGLAPE